MTALRTSLIGIISLAAAACAQIPQSAPEQLAVPAEGNDVTWNELTPAETRVIVHRGTEMPFSGKYENHWEEGMYTCKRCDAPLYLSTAKFDASCGWPSFDDEIEGAVTRTPDPDGMRTEITCSNCGAHLGHVFLGEGFTPTNTRHCVNSISMNFVPAGEETASAASASAQDNAAPGSDMAAGTAAGMSGSAGESAAGQAGNQATVPQEQRTETAYLAGGCFWGVEHFLERLEGVHSVRSGYMGGHTTNPTYDEVCSGRTGHAETVEVVFDPARISFETIARTFFEIHDPTQINRQGPDRGNQYRSAVFYANEDQKAVTGMLIGLLQENGYDVVTEVAEANTFWPAEEYHQDYYSRTGGRPYCHGYVKRFK